MKNDYFLKQSNAGLPMCAKAWYIIFSLLLLVIDPPLEKYTFIAVFALHTAFTGTLYFITSKWGLYIWRGQVYYKTLREHRINLQEIAGIKIAQEYIPIVTKTPTALTDSHGKPLYSIAVLRSLREEMRAFNGSELAFHNQFRHDIICYAVYDKDAVEYLLHLNPNIEIIM